MIFFFINHNIQNKSRKYDVHEFELKKKIGGADCAHQMSDDINIFTLGC